MQRNRVWYLLLLLDEENFSAFAASLAVVTILISFASAVLFISGMVSNWFFFGVRLGCFCFGIR